MTLAPSTQADEPETIDNNNISNVDSQETLADAVERVVEKYFKDMSGHDPEQLYRTVLDEVEKPLLTVVMSQCCGNQTRASQVLGLNRGTLRKKLLQHGLD